MFWKGLNQDVSIGFGEWVTFILNDRLLWERETSNVNIAVYYDNKIQETMKVMQKIVC